MLHIVTKKFTVALRPRAKQSEPGWTVEHQNCTVLATTPLDHKETFQSTRLWEIPGSWAHLKEQAQWAKWDREGVRNFYYGA